MTNLVNHEVYFLFVVSLELFVFNKCGFERESLSRFHNRSCVDTSLLSLASPTSSHLRSNLPILYETAGSYRAGSPEKYRLPSFDGGRPGGTLVL